jgi:hypothetical protein
MLGEREHEAKDMDNVYRCRGRVVWRPEDAGGHVKEIADRLFKVDFLRRIGSKERRRYATRCSRSVVQ